MFSDEFFASHFATIPVMAIFRGYDPETTVKLCERAWQAGITLVEVPIMDEAAEESFKAAVLAGTAVGKAVGAGTVLCVEQLERVAAAGGAFTVAPDLNEEVVLRAHELGIPHLPGVATSTEIGKAVRLGLTWVKAFPAAQLGSAWITAQHGPFPGVSFVATGGMSAATLTEYLDAGCTAIAVGSAFESAAGIDDLTRALAKR